jgi:hypothetical protein
MYTRRHNKLKKKSLRSGLRRSRKSRCGGKTGKKWTTAISAAEGTLKKTGSLSDAKKSLKKQALTNARKLFGSI